MRAFYHVLANTLFASITNFFVWFALVFWLYLETRSVLSTSIAGGVFMIAMALSGFWLGSFVDHSRKKTAKIISGIVNLAFFLAAFAVYARAPEGSFQSVAEPLLWLFVGLVLAGVLASNIRNIALPTLVTLLVPEDSRDRANGMVGMAMGVSSMGAGLTSGFALAYAGMFWVLLIGVMLTFLALLHLFTIAIPEPEIVHTEERPKNVDIAGTIALISAVPGLFALIFFTTFNNFLGGVFMALMDPYGLTLVPVEVWSALWGVLSAGFIIGGMYIAKKGLGKDPLRTLFRINILIWIVTIIFPIQPSIVLLSVGIFLWVCLAPFIEATEHTIIQKVVPYERQGRVFGFAQSVEMAASPLTAFLIGPIAQFIFIPFMTTGAGVALIGDWFGVGPGRGMALVFMLSGFVGLLVTLFAMRSRVYRLLAKRYQEQESSPAGELAEAAL